jgi:hypothetical protein
MSSVSTQRYAALGTLCRRPTALLLPLAPLVLLVLAGLQVASTARARKARRSLAVSADVETSVSGQTVLGQTVLEQIVLEQIVLEQIVAEPSTRVGRSFSAIRPTPRRAVGTAAALFGGILVAASMAGGTFAFLNSQAAIPATSVKAGTLGVTVQYGSGAAGSTVALPTTVWTNMLPGDFAGQQFTIASTGSANSNVTARLSVATAWDIRVAAGSCPATQLTNTPLTTTAGAYGTLVAGTSSLVCVQATLPAGASASAEATAIPFSIFIDAAQVPSP